MKRWKFVALAAILVGTVVSQAHADWSTTHLNTQPLRFRTHAAATVTPVDFMGGFVDSSVATRLGTQICPLDTTVEISTRGWAIPFNQAATDTSGFLCAINIYDATGSACATTADSLYIAVQGSMNGANWATLRTFKNGTISSITSRLDQTNVTGAFQGLLSANGASQAGGGSSLWRYVIKARAAQGGDNVDIASAGQWPLLRVIVGFPDAAKYQVAGSVTFPTTTVSE